MASRQSAGSATSGEWQTHQQREEFRRAVRALLMQPLMAPSHEDFPAVRRQAERLRDWFLREAGWMLQVERDAARLFKRPGDLLNATRGLPGFDRRRYVLLCLACAVLERADPQITLHLLGERVMELAAEPALSAHRFSFTLHSAAERRDLVAVCRCLLQFGVLQRVAGDEDGFVFADAASAGTDALYDIQRPLLAGMLAAVRGPSTWAAQDAPVGVEQRLLALVSGHVADTDEGRRSAMRHALARRLLDDPVLYTEALEPELQAYFTNQRGVMAARLCDATALEAEQRFEGLALVDETGSLSDVAMPAEGTEAHVTLLVAEFLASQARQNGAGMVTSEDAVAAHVRAAADRFGRYWRKSAREPGAERELAQTALERLHMLDLIRRDAQGIRTRPAIARFALGPAEVRQAQGARVVPASGSLF